MLMDDKFYIEICIEYHAQVLQTTARLNLLGVVMYICVIQHWQVLCAKATVGEEVIRSWIEDGSLVLLGFPLYDHCLQMGLYYQPAFI